MRAFSSTHMDWRHHAAPIAHPTRGWIEKLARFGYAAKGVVYVIVGLLAVQAAFGSEPTPDGTRTAFQTISAQPFGRLLLALTAVGLVGYVVSRFVEAVKDPLHRGSDAKGYAIRAGYIVSGLAYAVLAFTAAAVAIGASGASSGSDSSKQAWTAWLMDFPLGRWLVAAVGIAIGIVGLVHFYQAYTARFLLDYNLSEMSPTARTWAKRIGQFGLIARGVTFCLIAWLIAQAAIDYNPQEVHGLGGALNEIAAQPYGQTLMAAVAAGLAAYGVYCFTQARWKYLKAT